MSEREPMSEQIGGTEFGGRPRANGTQPVPGWEDLSPSEQARLMKTTGTEGDPRAIPTERGWNGQTGLIPRLPSPRKLR